MYKIWAKSNNPRLSYWRFSMFSSCNFRGRFTFTDRFSEVRGPNFTNLGEDNVASLFSEFGYLAAFSIAGCSNLSDVENDAKFRTFWPLWKFEDRWARSLPRLMKFTYDRTPGIHLMAIHCAADRKERKRKKESLSVKLKAFRHTCLAALTTVTGGVVLMAKGQRSAVMPYSIV